MIQEKKHLPKRSEDFSEWYNRVVLFSELADYGPAKGTMIFRPYGYGIWEEIQKAMDKEIKARGVQNAYFPLFIPESLLKKEKEHVEGFSPELAVVTIGGGEELKEKLIVRPTSETIMYEAYARWVQSWRDLPLLINQWNNVVRWEKRTYLFLRTSEFLWQEGHTAHATHEEAWEMVEWAIQMYAKIYRDYFAMPGYIGRKSESEKFAGADTTLTYEALMPEGKALQSCTSHDLGQNFARAFGIKFLDKEGKSQYVFQTSWGLSTRSIGGLVMLHGDDGGLRLPPRLAPIQVVIIPVKVEPALIKEAKRFEKELIEEGVRVKCDDREGESLGFRINKWELKGVPIRVEIGGEEIKKKELTFVRRDTGEKQKVKAKEGAKSIVKLLDQIQKKMLTEAEAALKKNTQNAASYEEFKTIMEKEKGFIRAFWCEDKACEAKIKEETKATTRCLPLDAKKEKGKCVYCGKTASYQWLFAQAY
ncbi:MAG: proline--tRNA ligase [Candidatus Colwellbacteria bacterium RIFCSPHIGHO2_12_FULL_44_17]|uniref:Proline--tRNA ligase n=2 Tax=Candidatus Colwelliibacteriota TaxID=1817904 RepID=A0A1G1Z8A1_9BACT|nr:MAG: proline--tRNA ligase [Candidatus Colwellbacteria bacterium RIFCSPHIGHO2_12_FULL_44_17]OGY60883.1 MAG: proline--tRNA ligase [Candidatus Colwellbacteria bacterium RIFCSPLOWO2_02_FULL_44_20b]